MFPPQVHVTFHINSMQSGFLFKVYWGIKHINILISLSPINYVKNKQCWDEYPKIWILSQTEKCSKQWVASYLKTTTTILSAGQISTQFSRFLVLVYNMGENSMNGIELLFSPCPSPVFSHSYTDVITLLTTQSASQPISFTLTALQGKSLYNSYSIHRRTKVKRMWLVQG